MKKDRKRKILLKDLEKKTRLDYHPVKDSIIIALSFLIVVCIFIGTYYAMPRSNNVYVEIKYGSTLLWDPEDATCNTQIQFPDEGEYTITYTKEDGEIFLGEGNYFEFYGDEVAVTLYSDKSIQITKEESPRNVCSNLGRIYTSYTPLVCLPNSIQATIVASSFPDYDS